jgi:hypothetical protein
VHDPKVQGLPPPLFKFWINLLCIVEERNGAIPPLSELKTALKARLDHLEAFLKALLDRGLVDQIEGGLEVHNWRNRQYKTDTKDETNNDRKKRFKELKQLNYRSGGTVAERPDTESDNTFSFFTTAESKRASVDNVPAGSLATALPSGALARQPSAKDRAKQGRAQAAWERDLLAKLGESAYAEAIDILAGHPEIIKRATAAELRRPGSGAMAAAIGLKRLREVAS